MTEPYAYLDNAATTPVRPEVRNTMMPFLTEAFGNPSSAHRVGRVARVGLETARRRIAEALGSQPADVIFTSGGTEADNLAVLGAALAARARGEPFRVAVSALEHKAVLEAAEAVEQLGGEAIVLPVDAGGQVDLDALDAALKRGVAVVSVMWVNNETGVMPNLRAVAARCEAATTPFHTDAVQAVGKVPCRIADAPIALMTISGHKIGAPKGIGALVLRDHHGVEALIRGGGQQQGIRPGTENVAGAVGLGEAVALSVTELDETATKTRVLRDDLEERLRTAVSDAVVNGESGDRAPHISSISFPGTDAESLMMHLDLVGIACSSGSACSTGSVSVSHVLSALGVPPELAMGSLRFSFRKQSLETDVDRVITELPRAVEKVRKLTESLRR
jgi:cysteine desulfurase